MLDGLHRLKIPLRFLPCGYTIRAETNRPTEIPMAVWIIPYPREVRELLEVAPEVLETSPVATAWAYSRPEMIEPLDARPDGTRVKMPGMMAAAACPCHSRLYKLARRPMVKAPTVLAT